MEEIVGGRLVGQRHSAARGEQLEVDLDVIAQGRNYWHETSLWWWDGRRGVFLLRGHRGGSWQRA